MSKKKRNKRTRKTLEFTLPFLDGDTILKRFRSLEGLRSCKVPQHEAIAFLFITNIMLAQKIDEETLDVALVEECEDFFSYLMLIYPEDHPIWVAVSDNWDSVHLLFEVACIDSEPDLSEDMERRCEALTDYIFNTRADRTLTLQFSEDDRDCYHIPQTVPREELDGMKEFILGVIRELADLGGFLLFSFSSSIVGTDILNGFLFQDDEVLKIGEAELRDSVVPVSPESDEDDDAPRNTIYQVAPVDLD